MKYDRNMFYKKVFLWQMMLSLMVFVMGLDSAAIAIVEFHAVTLRWRYDISIGDSIMIYAIKWRSVCALNGSPRIFVQASKPTAILAILEIS